MASPTSRSVGRCRPPRRRSTIERPRGSSGGRAASIAPRRPSRPATRTTTLSSHADTASWSGSTLVARSRSARLAHARRSSMTRAPSCWTACVANLVVRSASSNRARRSGERRLPGEVVNVAVARRVIRSDDLGDRPQVGSDRAVACRCAGGRVAAHRKLRERHLLLPGESGRCRVVPAGSSGRSVPRPGRSMAHHPGVDGPRREMIVPPRGLDPARSSGHPGMDRCLEVPQSRTTTMINELAGLIREEAERRLTAEMEADEEARHRSTEEQIEPSPSEHFPVFHAISTGCSDTAQSQRRVMALVERDGRSARPLAMYPRDRWARIPEDRADEIVGETTRLVEQMVRRRPEGTATIPSETGHWFPRLHPA
jgi:hypothetical protein